MLLFDYVLSLFLIIYMLYFESFIIYDYLLKVVNLIYVVWMCDLGKVWREDNLLRWMFYGYVLVILYEM